MICVIEQPEQFHALKRRGGDSPRIYCVCPETSGVLREQGVAFTEISDRSFLGRWTRINGWAKKTALSWFQDAAVRDLLRVEGINMGDVMHRPLTHLLIRQAKHVLLARQILEKHPMGPFVIFENALRGKTESNTFNELLGHMASGQGATISVTRCAVPPDRRLSLRSGIKGILASLLAMRPSRLPRCDLMVSGGLKHLTPVVDALRGRMRVGLFGVQGFQAKDLQWCRDRGLAYLLPGQVLGAAGRRRARAVLAGARKNLSRLETVLAGHSFFAFEGMALPLIEKIILGKMRQLLPVKVSLLLASKAIAGKCGTKMVLLDEDVDWRRVLAMAFVKEGVRTVVLSHGIPPSTSDMSGFISNAGVAQTIVNSDFERDTYIMAGWDPRTLHVLGLSRYDRIRELALRQGQGKPGALGERGDTKNDFTVLYCPHMLSRRRKRKEGFLGVHTPGNETRHHTLALIRACKNIGVRLVIKPHSDAGDIGLWEDLMRVHGGEGAELTSHAGDIFALIARADVVVATFSTVVLEAALFGKPAVSMNLSGKPDVQPFAERGIALGAHTEEELEQVLRKVLQGEAAAPSGPVLEYFCGRNDGRNTERVTRFLSACMENKDDNSHRTSQTRVLATAG